MELIFLLTIALVFVIVLLTILLIKHTKLKNDFKNYNPNPVFGPGRHNYGRDDPARWVREMRLERIREFFTFKWVWYWTTKEYRKKKKTKNELTRKFKKSIDAKKKARKLREKTII